MSLLPQLRTRLIYSHVVTDEQMAVAEQFASREGIPLDQALVTLQFTGYAQIGKSLSELSDIAYRPLLDSAPSPQAAGLMSSTWAFRWTMFPVSYDPGPQILTVAISSPDLVPRVHQLYHFFMEPCTLAFTIASKAEIRKALEQYFGVSAPTPSLSAPAHPDKTPSAQLETTEPTRPAEPKKAKIQHLSDASPSGTTKQRVPLFEPGTRSGSISPRSTAAEDDVGRYLASAAALLVTAYLGENSAALNNIRSRVRYAQLLAHRLGLPAGHVSQVVVATWLSALTDRPQVIRQFLTPYNLEEILFPKETGDQTRPLEGQILALLACYDDLRKQDPASCKEVSLTRRALHLRWSSSPGDQAMLETFLQILMDEQFLAKLDRAAGRILIVDPAEFSTSSMAPLLTNDGYDVSVVSTTETAWESIQQHSPDLILCGLAQPKNGGLALCQKCKGSAATAHVPFLFLMTRDEEKRTAECLRVGADDFLVKPVDPELLFLKLHKLTKAPFSDTSLTGVNGKLEDMSFTDMIQILSAGAKNMEVTLKRPGQEGQVFLREGNVIHAATDTLQGDEAFYELMKWREGSFTTKPCTTFPAATIQASTTSLLMEGSRLSDEAAELET